MRKILSIIAIVLLGVIAAGVIACSFIPKQFNINLETPDYVVVWKDGVSEGVTYLKNSEEYNQILEKYNASFKSTVLSSMFQGKLFASPNIVDSYHTLNLSTLISDDAIFIEFRYDTVKTVKFNGEEYSDSSDNKYVSIMIEVLDSQNLSEIKAYVRYGEAGTNNYSYYRYTTYAVQANLFDYINEITN